MQLKRNILRTIGERFYACGRHKCYRFKNVEMRDVIINDDCIEINIYLLDKRGETCLSVVAYTFLGNELTLIRSENSLSPQCKIDKMYFYGLHGVNTLFDGAETLFDAIEIVWSKCNHVSSLEPMFLSDYSKNSIKNRINYLLEKDFSGKGLSWRFGGDYGRDLILTYNNDESVLWLDFNRLADSCFTLKQLVCEHGIYGDGMNEDNVYDTIVWLLGDNKLIEVY